MGEVNVVFKESVHRIMDQIKNELYFWWPNKMGVTHKKGIRICTVLTIGIRGIPPNSAEC